MGLEIRKYGDKNFQHEDNVNDYKPYGANDITIIFEGNNVRLRSFKGRIVFERFGYQLNEVSVYDVGGSEEVFATIEALKQRLINLGYPFQGGVDVIAGGVEAVIGTANIGIDATDPQNPIASLIGVIDGGDASSF